MKLKLVRQILLSNNNTSDNLATTEQSDPNLETDTAEEPISTIFARGPSTTSTVDSHAASTSTIVSAQLENQADVTAKSDTETTRNANDSIEPFRPSRRVSSFPSVTFNISVFRQNPRADYIICI